MNEVAQFHIHYRSDAYQNSPTLVQKSHLTFPRSVCEHSLFYPLSSSAAGVAPVFTDGRARFPDMRVVQQNRGYHLSEQ